MAVKLDSATLQAALVGYQRQLEEIQAKMAELRRRLGRNNGSVASPARPGRPAGRRRHRMSAEGRARIAAAQRARWAKVKRSSKKSSDE
jgi:hypothetical protein